MLGQENSAPAIEIVSISKSFAGHLGLGRTVVIEGLTLQVRPGEIFGLLGPNGAGKTTTLKLLIGLLHPDRGRIRLLGGSPDDPAVRARIGFLPENPYFYDYLTAEEFLDFYARLQGISRAERRDRVRASLERVGLSGRGGTALRKFSKGMIQRLGVAQAIQHDPELVIFDEPMSGLDPEGRRQVRDLILSLREAGRTVLFSSHILQDAEMICDRVGILRRGRLIALGALDELVPGRVEWFEVAVRGASGIALPGEVISSAGGECLLRVGDPQALARLMAATHESNAEVTSIWPKRQTLEDLFLREIHRGEPAGRAR